MIKVLLTERNDNGYSKSINTKMPKLPSRGHQITFFQPDGNKIQGSVSIIEHVFDKDNNFMYVEITIDDGD